MRRYDLRIPTHIRVKVVGVDRHGNSFQQTASTVNVSRTGARLDGIGCVDGRQTVELRRGWFRKARFQVMWTGMPGTPQAGQVGLRQLDQDATFWGIPFPPTQMIADYQPPQSTAAIPATGPIPVDWSTPAPKRRAQSSGMPEMGPTIGETEVVDLSWQNTSPTAPTIRERVAAIMVRWVNRAGDVHEETCPAARVLRDKSCIVPMKTALSEGTEVTIVNTRTRATRKAYVSMCGPQMPDNSFPIALDLPAPDTAFWGTSA